LGRQLCIRTLVGVALGAVDREAAPLVGPRHLEEVVPEAEDLR
jgi:hypothetical protein